MKVGIIIYHSDLLEKYEYSYIMDFVNSIKKQTFQDFHIIELNYDKKSNISIMNKVKLYPREKYTFFNHYFENHINAQNFLLKYCFEKENYDIIMNTNIDDWYSHDKLLKQIQIIKNKDVDIVSSNFSLFQNINGKNIYKNIDTIKTSSINSQRTILLNHLSKNDSRLFQNSGCCITKKFYEKNNKVIYEDFPLLEVLFMCKKAIKKCNFYIIPEILTFQRVHINQLSYNHR